MTNRGKLISTIATFVIVLFVGIICISSTNQRLSLINVYASKKIDVSLNLEVTNAGNKVNVHGYHNIPIIKPGSSIDIEDLEFVGAGEQNAIVYTLIATNNTSKDVQIYLEELDENNFKNLGVKHNYSVAQRTEVDAFVNGGILHADEVLTISIAVYVKDGGLNAYGDIVINLSLNDNI